MAVARPIPLRAPVMRISLFFIGSLLFWFDYRIAPIRPTNQSTATASGTSAKAALAHSTSFSTVGAPLSPIAPTTSPFTLMGNPPPHAATRERVGMPAKSDGSPLIKLKKSCVETPNRAVYALFCAISMQRIGGSIHPTECLEIATIIENRYVLGHAKF